MLITNRKSYISFRLVPKSVTLNDLERRNGSYFVGFFNFLEGFALRKRHCSLSKSFNCRSGTAGRHALILKFLNSKKTRCSAAHCRKVTLRVTLH